LKEGIDSGHISAAALDVFEVEPAKEHPLFGYENVVLTPHLGASTREAQENVAIQVAEQMADYLVRGAVTNALNMPSVSAEEAPRLKPFISLAGYLGLFAGQLTETSVKGIEVVYAGDVAKLNTRPLTAAAVAGVLKPMLSDVNIVNAPTLAKERGIAIAETYRDDVENFESLIRLRIITERQQRSVSGALFGSVPRVTEVKGVPMEASFTKHMLFVTNEDRPGFIGALGQALGDAGVNIATFNLGRASVGDEAIALIAVDDAVSEETLDKVADLSYVTQVKALAF